MLNENILHAEAVLYNANSKYLNTVRAVQMNCDHRQVGEAPHSGGLPLVRICLSCGMTEDGWGISHQVLKSDFKMQVTREYVYTYRHGLILNEARKEKLLRKEATLSQLINAPNFDSPALEGFDA